MNLHAIQPHFTNAYRYSMYDVDVYREHHPTQKEMDGCAIIIIIVMNENNNILLLSSICANEYNVSVSIFMYIIFLLLS